MASWLAFLFVISYSPHILATKGQGLPGPSTKTHEATAQMAGLPLCRLLEGQHGTTTSLSHIIFYINLLKNGGRDTHSVSCHQTHARNVMWERASCARPEWMWRQQGRPSGHARGSPGRVTCDTTSRGCFPYTLPTGPQTEERCRAPQRRLSFL